MITRHFSIPLQKSMYVRNIEGFKTHSSKKHAHNINLFLMKPIYSCFANTSDVTNGNFNTKLNNTQIFHLNLNKNKVNKQIRDTCFCHESFNFLLTLFLFKFR